MRQADITEKIDSMIPAELLAKYRHLSYGEMAEIDELENWKSELLQAESDWFECEDA